MITIKTAATSMSVTGGSDQSFTKDGRQVTNGFNYVDNGDANFFTRDTLALKSVGSNAQGDGSYSREKRELLLRDPYEDATYGNQVVNARVVIDFHPTATSAQRLNARLRLGQLLANASMDAFWNAGTVDL